GVPFSQMVTPIGYIMNYIEELKRIKELTSDLVTHMIVNNPELDQVSVQLVKHRADLDLMIDVLECDAGDDNA
ncbi:hypothetical protein, partial [Acinetobacter geminorum]|uniref:hypothetical protein n=2 Tax=Moraxellaceae TaxID=468 RepID=UPI003AF48A18